MKKPWYQAIRIPARTAMEMRIERRIAVVEDWDWGCIGVRIGGCGGGRGGGGGGGGVEGICWRGIGGLLIYGLMGGWGGRTHRADRYMLINVCVRSLGGVCLAWVVGIW